MYSHIHFYTFTTIQLFTIYNQRQIIQTASLYTNDDKTTPIHHDNDRQSCFSALNLPPSGLRCWSNRAGFIKVNANPRRLIPVLSRRNYYARNKNQRDFYIFLTGTRRPHFNSSSATETIRQKFFAVRQRVLFFPSIFFKTLIFKHRVLPCNYSFLFQRVLVNSKKFVHYNNFYLVVFCSVFFFGVFFQILFNELENSLLLFKFIER